MEEVMLFIVIILIGMIGYMGFKKVDAILEEHRKDKDEE